MQFVSTQEYKTFYVRGSRKSIVLLVIHPDHYIYCKRPPSISHFASSLQLILASAVTTLTLDWQNVIGFFCADDYTISLANVFRHVITNVTS